jgi:hypothetical protein
MGVFFQILKSIYHSKYQRKVEPERQNPNNWCKPKLNVHEIEETINYL